MKGEGQALTDELIARLRPRSITYMRTTRGTRGLYLAVRPTGTKSWLLKLSDESGTARKMSGGTYGPTSGTHGTVSLDEARRWARNIQGVGSEGVALHVAASRQARRERRGFEQCARIWHARVTKSGRWKARYSATVLRMMERDIFSAKIEGSSKAFGEWRPRDIDHAAVTAVNRSVEQRGAVDTAADINMYIRAVFDEECLPSGHCSENPAARTHKQLSKPVRTHFASLKFGQLAEFFERLDQYPGDESTKIALELLVMLAPRSTEFRFARWSELQLDLAHVRGACARERMKDMARVARRGRVSRSTLAAQPSRLFKRLHKLRVTRAMYRVPRPQVDRARVERDLARGAQKRPDGLSQPGDRARLPLDVLHDCERSRVPNPRHRAPARSLRRQRGARSVQPPLSISISASS